jgi:hypothetical protein
MTTGTPSPAGGYRNNPTYAPQPDSTVPTTPSGDPSLSGIIAYDGDQLRMAKNGFVGAATDASTIESRLAAILGAPALGAHPWGQDPLGQAFEAQFAGTAEQAAQALAALGGILLGIADDLDRVGHLFAAADEDSTAIAMGR